MKFEIDPNELTTDQRAHVAAFITGWPGDAKPKDEVLGYAQGLEFYIPTEEQRLDAEQASDLGPIGDADLKDLVDIPDTNLSAIFGAPTATQNQWVSPAHAAGSSVPLDAQGLPWDSRIHASTKTLIADGSWKLRRGVDPAEVESVKVQLKELMAVPQPLKGALSAPIEDVSRIPVPPVPVPGPKSHYLIDQDPNVAANQQPVTLTDLIARMSSAIVAGKMTQATVAEMCAKHGVSEFMLLSNRPDLLPLIDADMKAMGV